MLVIRRDMGKDGKQSEEEICLFDPVFCLFLKRYPTFFFKNVTPCWPGETKQNKRL